MGSQAVRRPAAAILLVAIGGVWASNGTASALSCTVSDESMIVRFEGTYLGLAPGEQATVIPEPPIHRFETAAGEVIDVQLFGPVWTLEEGGDYAVPAMRDGEAGLDAAVPDYEWCGPLITRIDGSAIDWPRRALLRVVATMDDGLRRRGGPRRTGLSPRVPRPQPSSTDHVTSSRGGCVDQATRPRRSWRPSRISSLGPPSQSSATE